MSRHTKGPWKAGRPDIATLVDGIESKRVYGGASQDTYLAWHFTKGDSLRDGRPVPPVGERLVHEGEVVMCHSGLHASKRLVDALAYSPGAMLHRVSCSEVCDEEDDKLVCRQRTILWSIDATDVLREWARWCALQVVDLWDAPDVVREYLETGDDGMRDAAWAAAWAAAGAARDAARGAARAAQEDKLVEMVEAALGKEESDGRFSRGEGTRAAQESAGEASAE